MLMLIDFQKVKRRKMTSFDTDSKLYGSNRTNHIELPVIPAVPTVASDSESLREGMNSVNIGSNQEGQSLMKHDNAEEGRDVYKRQQLYQLRTRSSFLQRLYLQ